ncbi:HAD family hydrolase [Microbacterium sp. 179-I 3D4 NHS]|uniref:HAD family hydrolase n=1 Tax=Microbacterium sp. 179-I 3D4 NHS TaxID=3142381 RepID=UPI0039A01574
MTGTWFVALDVDGTILLQDESLSPGVPEAVARLRDAGHTVTIATGRSWMATRRWVEELGLDAEYVVCSNGAVTMRRVGEDWERWNVETFDPRPVLSLLQERLPDARYMVELASGQRLFTEQLDDWTLDGGRRVTFEELGVEPVSRVVVVSPDHDEEDFHRLVSDAGLNEVSYAIGWTAWLDIAPQGVDKGTALERVRCELGLDGERILVAGDGRNDIGMFGWARTLGGRAVAMGQAPAEVQDAGSELTDDVVDGGLARALNTLPAPAQVSAGE